MLLKHIIYFYIFLITLVAQETDHVIGKKFLIKSAILASEVEIQISLPVDYQESGKKYPVLYVFDEEWTYLNAISIVKKLSNRFNKIPHLIVVGINTNVRDRYPRYVSGKQNFGQFIKKELISYIDQEYRAKPDRLILTWQYASSFALDLYVDEPDLFSAFLLSSPFPLLKKHGGAAIEKFSGLEQLHSFIYLVTAENEGQVNKGVDSLNKLISKKQLNTKFWQNHSYKYEEHISTPIPTLYRGIQAYYKDYSALQFKNLAEYIKLGEMKYVNSYYKKRALRYELLEEVEYSTMWNLIRLGMSEKNDELFDYFVNIFTYEKLVQLSNHSRWLRRFAAYYEKSEKYDKALNFYLAIQKKFSEVAPLQNKIGDLFHKKKKYELAKKHYQKAVDIAKASSDKNLKDYETDLEKVKN